MENIKKYIMIKEGTNIIHNNKNYIWPDHDAHIQFYSKYQVFEAIWDGKNWHCGVGSTKSIITNCFNGNACVTIVDFHNGYAFEEIKSELGSCEFMEAFLNIYTVDAIRWLLQEVEILREKNKVLSGDNIECHMGRDILDSLYEAANKLPCCGTNAIIANSIQEIQALRNIINNKEQY